MELNFWLWLAFWLLIGIGVTGLVIVGVLLLDDAVDAANEWWSE